MKKIIILVVSLVLVFWIGTAMATDNSNPFEAIWNAIAGLNKRADDSAGKISCLELVKQTPDRGPGEWINIDIVRFYEESQRRLEGQRTNPSRPEEQNDEIAFWESVIAEAQPMHDRYVEECR